MKKSLLWLLSFAMMLSLLAGCGETEEVVPPAEDEQPVAESIAWPEKTVQVIVPYNAGGDTDLYARAVTKYLEQELGETFVIINSAGSSGMTAAQDMLSAAPDGYTMMFTHTAKLTQEAVGLCDFSFTSDFASGGNMVLDGTFCIVARADGPYQSLQDVVDASKANPESVRYSQVYGSLAHLAAVLWEDSVDMKLKWLDVGSSNGDKIAALLSDQCDLIAVNYSTVKDYVENGDLIVLGFTSEERLAVAPDIPTMRECGYDVVVDKRYSFSLPKDTDPAIIDKMNEAMAKVAENPEFAKEVEAYFGVVHYTDPVTTNEYESSCVEAYRPLFEASAH